jgi:hypothetical protein
MKERENKETKIGKRERKYNWTERENERTK